MNSIEPTSPESPFDGLMGEDGRWSARDLQGLMGYSRWENMSPAIERAKVSAKNQGMVVEEHFLGSQENPSEQGGRPRKNYRLSRMAAYLVAMNGDPNKAEVAAAQAYFATKTREAEVLAEESARSVTTPSEDIVSLSERRLRVLRLAEGLVPADWLTVKTQHVVGQALALETSASGEARLLTTDEFLSEKGVPAKKTRSVRSTFGKRLKAAYVLEYGEEPKKVERFIDGTTRPVNGYSERDRHLFEKVWSQYYT